MQVKCRERERERVKITYVSEVHLIGGKRSKSCKGAWLGSGGWVLVYELWAIYPALLDFEFGLACTIKKFKRYLGLVSDYLFDFL